MKALAALVLASGSSGATIAAPFTDGNFAGRAAIFQFNIPAGSIAIPGWV